MNKSQRIYLDPTQEGNDSHIKVRLQQETDSIEFPSMKIDTKDVYRDFNADYGVLVGRVLANGGIGVPNAKVSIFIPLAEEDYENGEIKSIYPYKSPRDKNIEGKRYNLLPRVSRINPKTQQIEPKQAFGSFPIKEEVVTNSEFLTVYKKYYKYTALTNNAGDYMIFGVPIGTQTVHLSVDITDIGEYSMNPASMVVNLGYSASQFIDRGTRIKPSTDLGDLPNIETQEISVDVIPFWGDVENFEIGITRQDFRIRAVLSNTFVMFGSAFTDGANVLRGTESESGSEQKEIRDLYFGYPSNHSGTGPSDEEAQSIATKRIGTIKETIYYYPATVSDYDIDNGNTDPQNDMQILDRSQYSVYTRAGDFVFLVSCNRDRVVTDDFGNQTPVAYDDPNGVFTTFRGFVTLEYEVQELPMVGIGYIEDEQPKDMVKPARFRYKFPQHAQPKQYFDYNDDDKAENWRNQYMKFEAKKLYGFARFLGCIANNEGNDNNQFDSSTNKTNGYLTGDHLNNAEYDYRYNIGMIITGNYHIWNNSQYGMISNGAVSDGAVSFGANWLNLSIYFPQVGYMVNKRSQIKNVRTNTMLNTQWKDDGLGRNEYFVFSNNMKIAANKLDTSWYPRNDFNWTDIYEVPLADIIKMKSYTTKKGFTDLNVAGLTLGNYRNGDTTPPTTTWKGNWVEPCPFGGGGEEGRPDRPKDPRYYFFKGFDTSDCIEFLYDLGIVLE